MDLGTLFLIILLVFVGVIVFWVIYYVGIIYMFIMSFVRDIIKKLR